MSTPIDHLMRTATNIVAVLAFSTYVALGIIDGNPLIIMPAVLGTLYALGVIVETSRLQRSHHRIALHAATAGARGDYAEAELARLRRLRHEESR